MGGATKEDTSISEQKPTTGTAMLSTKELDDFKKLLLSDFLEETTKKERSFLLGISLIAFASVKTGLVPTKITALGIESSQLKPDWFLFILGIVVLYFWFAFLVHGTSNAMLWWSAMRFLKQNQESVRDQALKDTNKEMQQAIWSLGNSELLNKIKEKAVTTVTNKYSPFLPRDNIVGFYPIAYFRVFFDVFFPLLVGPIVMFFVVRKILPSFWPYL